MAKVGKKTSQKNKHTKKPSRKLKKKNLKYVIPTCCGVLFLLGLSFLNLTLIRPKQSVPLVLATQDAANPEKVYWNEFLDDNLTYAPGWIRLAEIEFLENRYLAAKDAIFKAKETQPNNKELKDLEVKINRALVEDIQERDF